MDEDMIEKTAHLGLIPTGYGGDMLTDLNDVDFRSAGFTYLAESYSEWGEPAVDGQPVEVTCDLSVAEPIADSQHGLHSVARDLTTVLRGLLLQADLGVTWRVVDYVVFTDQRDHSKDARTVGLWEFA